MIKVTYNWPIRNVRTGEDTFFMEWPELKAREINVAKSILRVVPEDVIGEVALIWGELRGIKSRERGIELARKLKLIKEEFAAIYIPQLNLLPGDNAQQLFSRALSRAVAWYVNESFDLPYEVKKNDSTKTSDSSAD